jgi:carboxymethylenebutenolidase
MIIGGFQMQRKDIKIRSQSGSEFDCYMVVPEVKGPVPAIVLASAVHGVDGDIRAIADEFGQAGYLVAAPDLFWRTVPGPLSRTDDRTKTRSQPRLDVIRLGEQDMVDTLKTLAQYSQFNGRAIAMGFCYGGPYAILGPKRLGYSGGVSCHGTQLGDFAHELNGTTQPISIIWGDQDHAAPAAVQAMYRAIPQTHKNVAVHIFPGILHGYMMKENPTAFDQATRDFSMNEALKLLQGLHTS